VGTFLKRVKGHFANEVAVVTPNGKMLSADLAAGLNQWKKLPEAERKHLDDLGPYDPAVYPAPPRGGLILKVCARGLERDDQGRLQIYRNPKAHLSREPGRDYVWFTESEWKSLVPARCRKGDSFAVPGSIADRICRRYLIDLVRVGGNGGPRRPEQVLSQELGLTVAEASAERVRLRLDGAARFVIHGPEYGAKGKEGKVDDFRLLGFLDYDAKRQAFTRFDVVALSETGYFDEAGRAIRPLGVAFELTPGDVPADRVAPSSFAKDYFANRSK
jgi:hypothetical protein